MSLSADIQAFLEELPQFNTNMSPQELRAGFPNDIGSIHVNKIKNFTIPGPAGDIPVRLYAHVEPSKALPIVIFFHGGGYIAGSLDSHDAFARELAVKTGYIFISVDYRLAPEAKFPAALEDCYAATTWVHTNAASINADPSKIVLMGDSAGGGLTASTALMARDKGGPPIAFQLLICPVISHPSAYDSYESFKTNATGYLLTRKMMEYFMAHYLPEPISQFVDNPYVTPIKASNLKCLPPALVMTAEYDPLRDEGEAYGAKLKENGVPTKVSRYDGAIHGFAMFAGKHKEIAHKEIHDVLENFFTANTVLL